MNTKYFLYISILLLVVSFSCKVIKPYQSPETGKINLYRDQNTTDLISIASVPWQTYFADTVLKSLIKEGLDKNLNLKIAVQKIYEAQYQLNISKGALLP